MLVDKEPVSFPVSAEKSFRGTHFQKELQIIRKAGVFSFKEIHISEKLLVEVMADDVPQSIIGNGVDMGGPGAHCSEDRKGIFDDLSISEGVGVAHEGDCQISCPGEPVPLDPVVEKIHHAKVQGVGAVHPDPGQLLIPGNGESSPVGDGMKKGFEGHLGGRGIFDSDISERQRHLAAPETGSDIEHFSCLLFMLGPTTLA